MQPLVSIITVNYNSLEITCELLDSIRRISYANVEIIVVDNASSENPAPFLATNYPEVKVVLSQENVGFAGGNNLGIAASRGDYLFFVNNDAELTEGAVDRLLKLFDKVPNLGIVSPKICHYNAGPGSEQDVIQFVGATHIHPLTARNSTLGEGEIDAGQYTKARPTAYVHGAAMMVPRKVVEEVGRMPEAFFLYYEELDWCEQIRRAGYEIYVEPSATIYHKESVSVGTDSPLKTYFLNRNRILFMRRNRGGWQFPVFCIFLLFVTIPKNALLFLRQGQTVQLKAFLKAVWWNVRHGFRRFKFIN